MCGKSTGLKVTPGRRQMRQANDTTMLIVVPLSEQNKIIHKHITNEIFS